MSEHYHDVGDLRFLKEMGKLAPTEFNAWVALDKIVGRDGGCDSAEISRAHRIGCGFHDAMSLLHRGAHESREGRGRLERNSPRVL
jgi:hypothetical protein